MTQTRMSQSECETLQEKLTELADLLVKYGQIDLEDQICKMIDDVHDRTFAPMTPEEAFEQYLDDRADRLRDEARGN